MEHEYEERCQGYETRIDSLKGYYEAIIGKKNSPRYVMMNWVKINQVQRASQGGGTE